MSPVRPALKQAFRTAALAVFRLLAVLGVLSASARLASTAVRNSSFHCEPSHASFPVDHRSCCAGVDRAGAVALFTRLERGLRDEIAEAGRAGRAESSANFAQFQQTVTAQLTQSSALQNNALNQQL